MPGTAVISITYRYHQITDWNFMFVCLILKWSKPVNILNIIMLRSATRWCINITNMNLP